jgi:hypothetical protein
VCANQSGHIESYGEGVPPGRTCRNEGLLVTKYAATEQYVISLRHMVLQLSECSVEFRFGRTWNPGMP